MPLKRLAFDPYTYGLRYHPLDTADINEVCIKLINFMRDKEEPHHRGLLTYIIGSEVGIIAERPHIHLHFQTNLSKNTVKSNFHKFRESIGDTRSRLDNGNSFFAFSTPKLDLKNGGTVEQQHDRWFRYPLKECGLLFKEHCTFPAHWIQENCPEYMSRLAKDEAENKERDIAKTEEHNAKKEAKKAEVIELLDELHHKNPFTNSTSIAKELILYYSVERESVDLRHIANKTLFFELRYSLTTADELAREAISKYR